LTLLKFGLLETSLSCAMVAMIAGIAVQARAAGPDVVVTEQDNGKADHQALLAARHRLRLVGANDTGFLLGLRDTARAGATAQNAGPDGSANAWRLIGAGICPPRAIHRDFQRMVPADLLRSGAVRSEGRQDLQDRRQDPKELIAAGAPPIPTHH
jgi:hypothetical protein